MNALRTCKLECMPAGANVWSRCVSSGWVVLLCMVLVGCSGTAPSIRSTPEVGAGFAAGEVVVGGAVAAAVGSGLLVCLTAKAAANGEKTPTNIADEYYGTHFGDVKGWVQGQYLDAPRSSGASFSLTQDTRDAADLQAGLVLETSPCRRLFWIRPGAQTAA